MIILGNKHTISKDEIKQVQLQVQELQQIDLIHTNEKENIAYIIDIVTNKKPKYLVLNLDKTISLRFQSLLKELGYLGVKILVYSDFSAKFLAKQTPINKLNLLLKQPLTKEQTSNILKRIFDIVFSICAIIGASIPMVIIAILIKIKSPKGSVFFTQLRMGKNQKFFRVYKFRTMVNDAEDILDKWLQDHEEIQKEYLKYRKLQNDPRIIPSIGNFLRKSSLDELPQFFNVLLGSMSVVGPRPYIENEFNEYDQDTIKTILKVKPGITGYWQVGARSNATFDERVQDDLHYVKHQTLLLDIKIIFQTISVILFKKGA